MAFHVRIIAPLCSLLVLAACGGGGGGSGDTSGGGGTTTGVTYTSAPYPTSPAALVQQLTDLGASGYFWTSPIAYTGDNGTEFEIYTRPDNTTYTYEVLALPASVPDMLAQANAEGARGFARVSMLVAGETSDGLPQKVIIYRHIVGSTASYSYESLTTPTTDAEFLAQANAEGARGFFFAAVAAAPDTPTAAFYVKDSASTAVYAYTGQPLNDTPAAFLTQANAQGANGYRYFGSYFFVGQTSSIYVRDTSQSSQFVYSDQPAVNHVTDYLAQANAQGADGLVLSGEMQFGSTTQDFYFLPQHCTGLLCTWSVAL